jgi:hypothetical protein
MTSEKFTFEQFAMFAMALSEGWPTQKPLSEAGLRFFHSIVCEWDLGLVEEALKMHARSEKGEWRPTPAHIVAHLPSLKAEISAKERATLAWVAVERALSCHAPYRKPNVDALSFKIVTEKMGGWSSLSRVPNGQNGGKDDELKWRRLAFIDFYQVGLKIKQVHDDQKRLKNNSVKEALSLDERLLQIEQAGE